MGLSLFKDVPLKQVSLMMLQQWWVVNATMRQLKELSNFDLQTGTR